MVNPFEYGGLVTGEAFCNRTRELADLKRAAENGERLLIYAERRMGKTSLVRRTLAELPDEDYLTVYVDLWPTTDALSLATTLARAITVAAASHTERILETARDLFRHLVPSMTIDESGQPSLHFGVQSGQRPEPSLEEVLDGPQRLAERHDRRVVVALDEVQRLAEYPDDLAERLVRSHVQAQGDVAYFFLGSRKHLIQQMFMEERRPLYHAAGHYPIATIATEHWIPFIQDRFEGADKTAPADVVRALCERTGGHPFYTQHLAHDLWEITREGEGISLERLDQAEALLLRRLGYTYSVLFESLTLKQQSLLRGVAAAGPGAQPFAASFLERNGLAASTAHRAAATLVERDILAREEDGFLITDRFFRLWLRRL